MPGKSAVNSATYRREWIPFGSARNGFAALLEAIVGNGAGDVLLPDYIGWSPREGSGIFDPIAALGLPHRFYKMTRDLTIDVSDLAQRVRDKPPAVLLLVHYFGYPDPAAAQVAALARDAGITLIEDEAHALFSDAIGGVCGRWGQAALFSLHKMLPLPSGGFVCFSSSAPQDVVHRVRAAALTGLDGDPFSYDWWAIAQHRVRNAHRLLELLNDVGGVRPLWPVLPQGVIPQTLPIIVESAPRNELYFKLNDAGFGVVSLYHTLVDAISVTDHPDAHWLSQHIMNLPLHQDADEAGLERLVTRLAQLTR
jgi:dTDP-4-amino-4,6-dideoxygalactose transaminase